MFSFFITELHTLVFCNYIGVRSLTRDEPLIFAAIRIADNMDLFRILHDSDQALSSKELAERTKSDPTLLGAYRNRMAVVS